jgi:hypothetical protein
MSEDVKKKNIDNPSPPGGGNNSFCGGQRNHCNRWTNAMNALPGKFKRKTQGIENDIFNNTGPHNAANFHCSLKYIMEHLQLIHGNEVSEAIRTMTPVTITILPVPSS